MFQLVSPSSRVTSVLVGCFRRRCVDTKPRPKHRHHYTFHFLDIHGRTSLIFCFLCISTYYPRKYSFNILIPHAHLPPLWTPRNTF
ncbi:uncharacterized protein K441DRAFT_40522 [Cenococcum geophilum 1.58]|uniref:uncharacterized protein n=1 Tax=Cenococcum geophilum 1.58 TaxID=794803 RepID=UPI0035900B4E|nr:hypothetical protein K441DRAFT_40522 [Cenococcum geophilum 1.58]